MMGRHHAPLGAIAGGIAATLVAATPAEAGPLPGTFGWAEFLIGRGARLMLPVLLGLAIGGIYGLLPDLDQDGSDITYLPDTLTDVFENLLAKLRERVPHSHNNTRREHSRAHRAGVKRRGQKARKAEHAGVLPMLGYGLTRLFMWLLIAIIALVGDILTLVAHAISKVVHVLSGGHRRMTHTVWLAGLFSLPLLYFFGALPFWAAFAGYMCHLVADATTHSGVNFFRPLTPNPQWVVPRFLTYHTDTPAEDVMFWVMVVLMVVGWGALIINRVPLIAA